MRFLLLQPIPSLGLPWIACLKCRAKVASARVTTFARNGLHVCDRERPAYDLGDDITQTGSRAFRPSMLAHLLRLVLLWLAKLACVYAGVSVGWPWLACMMDWLASGAFY
jgi:hypothetical protein